MTTTIGSLFSGIGGLELGLEWAGLGPVAWQVETSEFCRAVLAKHWPNADRSVTDVRAASASVLSPVDLICGGFPCQDVSSAGKRVGLEHGERSGLWREYRRIVDELRPQFVVVENVASGARAWLCSVRTDLHALGYRTRALGLALLTSEPLTAGPESSSWPTTTAQYRATYGMRRGKRSMALQGAVNMWPTPSVTQYGSNQGGDAGRSGPMRPSLAAPVKHWPTPRAHDERGGCGRSANARSQKTGGDLKEAVSAGSLNPSWVAALMGFPPGWLDGLPAEVLSPKRGSRRASSPM